MRNSFRTVWAPDRQQFAYREEEPWSDRSVWISSPGAEAYRLKGAEDCTWCAWCEDSKSVLCGFPNEVRQISLLQETLQVIEVCGASKPFVSRSGELSFSGAGKLLSFCDSRLIERYELPTDCYLIDVEDACQFCLGFQENQYVILNESGVVKNFAHDPGLIDEIVWHGDRYFAVRIRENEVFVSQNSFDGSQSILWSGALGESESCSSVGTPNGTSVWVAVGNILRRINCITKAVEEQHELEVQIGSLIQPSNSDDLFVTCWEVYAQWEFAHYRCAPGRSPERVVQRTNCASYIPSQDAESAVVIIHPRPGKADTNVHRLDGPKMRRVLSLRYPGVYLD